MKKKKLLIALSCLTLLSFVGCGETSSSNSELDTKVKSIEIVKNSIQKTYSVGDKVSYSSLAINTLNAKKEVIQTLKASENKSITYTSIDTSKVATGIFEVTYTENDETFKTTMEYAVNDIQYTLVNWMPSDTYTSCVSYKANSKISTSEENPEQGFIETPKYYIGNDNAVSLLPKMTSVNPNNPLDTKTIYEIPSNVTFTLTNSDNETLDLNAYLDNISELKSKGLVKFKDSVEGEYTLKLTSPDQDQAITYTLNVVDAYNVLEAKDVFALDNCKWSFYSTQDKMRTYKTENNIPDAKGLVFQNDITFNKSDLPSHFFWGDEATAESVKGSYKDWQGLINYYFEEPETVNVFGNAHKFMLNDSSTDEDAFPLITTDSQQGEIQQTGKPISSHASIFYTTVPNTGVETEDCVLNIQDLEFSGNMGVSSDDEITTGGPMFIKSQTSSSFKNVIVSKTYIAYMLDNWSIDGVYHDNHASIENCRFRDLANGALYIYKNGKVTIKNSDLLTTGGPLIFINPVTQFIPTYTSAEQFQNDLSKLVSTDVVIDDKSFLSNYTAGTGGWFAAYEGAEAYSASIKALSPIMQGQFQMDFLNANNKFNFISFVLPISSSEGLGLSNDAGGINVNVTIGGKKVYSTLDGLLENYTKAFAYASATQGSQEQTDALMSYVDSLSSTDFGNNLTFAGVSSANTFKVIDAEGKNYYGLVNTDGNNNYWIENTKYTILNTLGFSESILSSMGINKLAGDSFKTSGYLSANLNSVTLAGGPTNITEFKGVCNYGLILGDYHSIATSN